MTIAVAVILCEAASTVSGVPVGVGELVGSGSWASPFQESLSVSVNWSEGVPGHW
jgi:hypothetical protein